MLGVLHLHKLLQQRPERLETPGVGLRTYHGVSDIALWLDLRSRSFAREKLGVRQWDRADFEREFLTKDWWSPERMWFACVENSPANSLLPPAAVGTVTLALRGSGPDAKPVVHWLAVLSAWRRRGIGQLLMSALHDAAWEAGYRDVHLETHARWMAGAAFYEALGYRPVEG
jgi:GNAT superfamily N-acetyltransferase